MESLSWIGKKEKASGWSCQRRNEGFKGKGDLNRVRTSLGGENTKDRKIWRVRLMNLGICSRRIFEER